MTEGMSLSWLRCCARVHLRLLATIADRTLIEKILSHFGVR